MKIIREISRRLLCLFSISLIRILYQYAVISEEKNKYPHDNFISNNLDQEGYIKMIGALFDWLDI